MTPEQYKKMQELQKEVEEIKLNRRKEVFYYEAQKISDRYQLTEPEMVELFDYARWSTVVRKSKSHSVHSSHLDPNFRGIGLYTQFVRSNDIINTQRIII